MKAYEYLIKYAKVYTTSDELSNTCPSTERQKDLGRMIVKDLIEIGVEDAHMDDLGYVYGTIPASKGLESKHAIGFIAHMDTAPDASGENVKPVLHENYDGELVVLESGRKLDPVVFPFLKDMKGETLITTDGTTLLGADDKAGVSEIVYAAKTIIEENRPHCKICIGITPDEEIGRGADKFDIKGFGADFAYTVDGGDAGSIEYENFNAASAKVKVKGLSVHPGESKNTMINASNVAMEFHMALPVMDRPEHTKLREGFYHLTDMKGDVNNAELDYILRDHDIEKLEFKKYIMEHTKECLNEKYGEGTVEVKITDEYRNMVEQIKPHFHLIETARDAIKKAGLTPVELPVRGGTDGARLSWMGLPCPNLGTGGFNFHGEYECTTVERMDKAAEIVLNIIELYSK